jgi:UDP-N-acetylmuramoyl-tripeptide--D-alanyl-D-alanine ligase
MRELSLSAVAALAGGTLRGEDRPFQGLAIDSRRVVDGNLFVALTGEHTDGHRFLEAAREAGAAGALVARPVDDPLPQVVVADPRRAMGEAAAAWRRRFDLPVVAVTGSNGKTTVKEMLSAVLSESGQVLATEGNLNNDLGVPLTLSRLEGHHDFAVIEMGANHAGEIAGLCRLAAPRVGIITQCAPAHLEGFGSVEGVARAKGEIYQGLDPEGFAVINADDPYAEFWQGLAAGRAQIRFGLERAADVTATWQGHAAGSTLRVTTPVGVVGVELPLPGRHNVMNALAVTAVVVVLGLPLETVAAGLAAVAPVSGRLRHLPGRRGARVVDDAYNANPGSVRAAVDYLKGLDGERWLVLGDMAELGDEAEAMHAGVGRHAKEAGIERLFTCGELSAAAARVFGPRAVHYPDRERLIPDLQDALHGEVVVLVKGSRSAGMEAVVAALAEEAASCS